MTLTKPAAIPALLLAMYSSSALITALPGKSIYSVKPPMNSLLQAACSILNNPPRLFIYQ
ncbi:hypothetical protein D0P93_13885 [Salmonella enterica]|nr:hypothetical protein [Salmonella enterica]ECU8377338.1 hypothetical protein [Salmonella enterica subsp. arizonae serovar 13,23:gz51:-]